MATNDPYAVLGVAPGADPDTLRRAFRRCARHTHPDAGGDALAFARVRGAYEMLTGPRPRTATVPSGPPARSGDLVRRGAGVPFQRTEPGRTWTREVREPAPERPAPDFARLLADALRAA
ncbi:MAG: J domain-containing protein [Acidimicrobiales bacterium]|nr:J domain-containing protein [Acidimicrobiales bacterium]